MSQSQDEILTLPVPQEATATTEGTPPAYAQDANVPDTFTSGIPAISMPDASSDVVPDASLDPELLSALGAATSDTPEFGENIHTSLANLWTPLLKKGLPKEDREKISKNYLVPGNCKLLQAPKLNAEISAAVSELVRSRDKKLCNFQQQLGTGTSAINKAMNILLTSDDKISALKYLSDSCRVLSDLHFSLSRDRIKLIIPSLEKNFLHVIQDAERDETLFGTTLSEKIKASKAIEKQGSQIRKTVSNQRVSASQPPSNRPAPLGNWSGPPRYSSIRGGRGGQRKHPSSSTQRRTYPPAPTPAKSVNYNQAKPRAPPPQ